MSSHSSVTKIITSVTQLMRHVLVSPETRRMLKKAAAAAVESLDSDTKNQKVAHRGGRPVSTRTFHSRSQARTIIYQPSIDGDADPGEVVWTWVDYEEENGKGKDRPVLVVGRDKTILLGLMMSSRQYHANDENWLSIGKGPWDNQDRTSYVRLDRILEVPEQGIRREGAILDKNRFDKVAQRLRDDYGWS